MGEEQFAEKWRLRPSFLHLFPPSTWEERAIASPLPSDSKQSSLNLVPTLRVGTHCRDAPRRLLTAMCPLPVSFNP